jgi:amidase
MLLHQLEAQEIVKYIRSGELTAEAMICSCLEQIEAREEVIRAWEFLDSRQALEQARNVDNKKGHGLLQGVPVGVKDLFDTCDMPTGYGSEIYRGNRPAWDAAVVSALRAAGAIILGKTVTTEFALYRPGKTTNPHNSGHTPGGSSSGSAAAVAAGMVPLSLGTQTAGSVIRPASYCGVVGFKPTFGLIPRAGLKLISESLDTIGTFTRSVADAALLTSVLSGRPDISPVTDVVSPPCIGLCRTPQWSFAEEATTRAFAQAAELLQNAGALVVKTSLPAAFKGLATAQEDIMAYEAFRSLAFEKNVHEERLSETLSSLLSVGEVLDTDCYVEAQALARRCRENLDEVFQKYDVLLVPSATGEAPSGLAATGDPIFSRIWTLLHVPCINLPGLRSPLGLPVGIQLVGNVGRDAELLAAAGWVERCMPDMRGVN